MRTGIKFQSVGRYVLHPPVLKTQRSFVVLAESIWLQSTDGINAHIHVHVQLTRIAHGPLHVHIKIKRKAHGQER
jgi:hypothetical protein